MSVIIGRALPDVRDGLKPVHVRILYAMYDGGYRPDRGLLQVLAGRRRRHGQLPPARRQRDLRRAGPDGAALVDADAADRQPGQLRLAGQRPARGHAVHRMPPGPAGDGDAAGHQRGYRRLPGELRRPLVRARRAAEPVPQPADQRVRGDRGRHGHQDPAAQPARGRRRRRLVPGPLRRLRRGTAGRADGADQGPGLPDPRPDRGPARHQGRLPHRARLDHHAGRRRGRGRLPGPHLPGRQGTAVPGQPGQPGPEDRRAGQGRPDQRHRRRSRTRAAAAPASGWSSCSSGTRWPRSC